MMAAGHNILHRRGNEKGTLTLTSKSLVVVFLIKMQRNRTRLEWVKKKVYNLASIKFQCSQRPLNCVAHICRKGYTLVLLSKYTDRLFNQLFINVFFFSNSRVMRSKCSTWLDYVKEKGMRLVHISRGLGKAKIQIMMKLEYYIGKISRKPNYSDFYDIAFMWYKCIVSKFLFIPILIHFFLNFIIFYLYLYGSNMIHISGSAHVIT